MNTELVTFGPRVPQMRTYQENPNREDAADEPDPKDDLNRHLQDILKDVGRVVKALNEDGQDPKISDDAIKAKLCDISNSLDDLYNEIRGI